MDRRIRERIKDMFAIHRGEAEAWVAVIVVIIGLAVWVTYEQWFAAPDPNAFAQEDLALQAWLAERSVADSTHTSGRRLPAVADLFQFDPNGLPVEQWTKLGLSEKQALTIHKYEERGGRFKSKADLARMRVIKPELFELWKPFILLPDSSKSIPFASKREWPDHKDWSRDTSFVREERAHEKWEPRKVEVNSCDTTQLIALPGIGPSFARGIVKYRDQLGGYVNIDQLAEVFVLKDKPEAVEKLKGLLVIDTLMVHRIAINSCTVEELAANPYLRWKLAKPLIAYRQQHGPFTSIEAIKGCSLITEEVYRKIAPYLSL